MNISETHNEKWIIDSYNMGMSANEIGKIINKNHYFVIKFLKEKGIPIRTRLQAKLASRDNKYDLNWICNSYKNGMSSYRISQEIGVDCSTVRRWIKNKGISLRTCSESAKIKYEENKQNTSNFYLSIKNVGNYTLENIINMYQQGYSANKIGKLIGKDHHFVLNILRYNNITTRDKKNAIKNIHRFTSTNIMHKNHIVYKDCNGKYFYFHPWKNKNKTNNLRILLEQSKCECCKKPCFVRKHRKNTTSFCSNECSYKMRSGAYNYKWTGGIKKKDSGYILIYCPDHPGAYQKYVSEHRLVVERHIKRYLTHEEFVHHINGIKDDNRIENLVICSKQEHTNAHNSMTYLLKPLIDSEIIYFDFKTKTYKMIEKKI